MLKREPTVITGVGVITPLGECKEDYWAGIRKGVSGIRDLTVFDGGKYGAGRAGEIPSFDPARYLGKKGLKYLSRTTQLAMCAVSLCLGDAGIKNDRREYLAYGPETVGLALGTTLGVAHSIHDFDKVSLTEGPQAVSPMAFPNLVMNCHAGYVAIRETIQGANLTLATGYAASLDAVGVARCYLDAQLLECAVVGGVEELSEEALLAALDRGKLSHDAALGEGCSAYAIEKLGNAKNRQARIYAEIGGYASVLQQGRDGLARAIELALQDAGIPANRVDWIVPGINGAESAQKDEAEALRKVFSTALPTTDLLPLLGDSYSAGGSLQLGAALGVIEEGSAHCVMTLSADPSGNCSALIVKRHIP